MSEDHNGDLEPLDRRWDSILIKVERRGPYFGMVDVGADCQFVNTVGAETSG
jgi:hypothetical protein